MSALTRLLLIPATLSLWSGGATAKDIGGLPKELIGTFSDSPQMCRSYFERIRGEEAEKYPAYTFYEDGGEYHYSDCLGRQCHAIVLSHSAVKNGYVLNMKYTGLHGSFMQKLSITKIAGNALRFHFLPDGKPFNVVRCSRTPFEPDDAPPGGLHNAPMTPPPDETQEPWKPALPWPTIPEGTLVPR